MTVEPSERWTPATAEGAPNPTPVRYAGLITRALAFALDSAVINVVALVVAVGAALIVSLFRLSHDVKAFLLALAGFAYVLWIIGYFVGFWSTTGQTPGDRVMGFRIVTTKGQPLKPRRALVRFIGLVLAALPLFAGYLLILFDRRRRGLQDRLARTVVIEARGLPAAASRGMSGRTPDETPGQHATTRRA